MSKRKSATDSKPRRGHAATKSRSTGSKTKGVPATKTQACLDLLSRASGATLEEMQDATGWQLHSVRGLLSGKIKKMPGVRLTSEKPADGPRRYYFKAA